MTKRINSKTKRAISMNFGTNKKAPSPTGQRLLYRALAHTLESLAAERLELQAHFQLTPLPIVPVTLTGNRDKSCGVRENVLGKKNANQIKQSLVISVADFRLSSQLSSKLKIERKNGS